MFDKVGVEMNSALFNGASIGVYSSGENFSITSPLTGRLSTIDIGTMPTKLLISA